MTSLTIQTLDEIPRSFRKGQTLEFVMDLPSDVPVGFFHAGENVETFVTSQLHRVENAGDRGFIANLDVSWEPPPQGVDYPTRLRFKADPTDDWPLGPAEFDVKFMRTKGLQVKTRVNAFLTGEAGVVIPAGTRAATQPGVADYEFGPVAISRNTYNPGTGDGWIQFNGKPTAEAEILFVCVDASGVENQGDEANAWLVFINGAYYDTIGLAQGTPVDFSGAGLGNLSFTWDAPNQFSVADTYKFTIKRVAYPSVSNFWFETKHDRTLAAVPARQTNHAYLAGDFVHSGGKVWRAQNSGDSGSDGATLTDMMFNPTQAQDYNVTWRLLGDGTAAAVVDLEAVNYGPIPCQLGSLVYQISEIGGWYGIFNDEAASTIGSLQTSKTYRSQPTQFTIEDGITR